MQIWESVFVQTILNYLFEDQHVAVNGPNSDAEYPAAWVGESEEIVRSTIEGYI